MRFLRFLLLFVFFLPLMVARADTPTVSLPPCTQAQHDSYKVQGPDGQWYATWHPQIDAYYGCYEDHEHGSNPALFAPGVYWQAGSGKWPLFGYSAAQMGMSEGHPGFKIYVFETAGGRKWMLTQHQGTANAALAACTRYHTLDIQSDDIDIHGMADFGGAVENTTGTPICGVVESSGMRQLPVGEGSIGYEPWRTDVVSGTLDARLSFNTLNPHGV